MAVPSLRTPLHHGWAMPARRDRDRPRDDGLDLAVHQTVAHGGTVWAVTAHEDLGPVEGVAALLRY